MVTSHFLQPLALSCWSAWSSFDHSGSVNGKGGCSFIVTDLSLQVLSQQSAQTDPLLISVICFLTTFYHSKNQTLNGTCAGRRGYQLFIWSCKYNKYHKHAIYGESSFWPVVNKAGDWITDLESVGGALHVHPSQSCFLLLITHVKHSPWSVNAVGCACSP